MFLSEQWIRSTAIILIAYSQNHGKRVLFCAGLAVFLLCILIDTERVNSIKISQVDLHLKELDKDLIFVFQDFSEILKRDLLQSEEISINREQE